MIGLMILHCQDRVHSTSEREIGINDSAASCGNTCDNAGLTDFMSFSTSANHLKLESSQKSQLFLSVI